MAERSFGNGPGGSSPAGAGRGTVVRVARKGAVVRLGEADSSGDRPLVRCALGGRLFGESRRDATVVVAGDEVEVEIEAGGRVPAGSRFGAPAGRITRILPRRNELKRTTGPEGRRETRTLAANLDRFWIVSAFAEPPWRTGFLDRSLVIAFASGVTPALVFNKSDRAATADFGALERDLDRYRSLDLETHLTSTVCGHGLDSFRASIASGRSVLFGHSGVGKTALLAGLGISGRRTGALDRRGRGRHTTTSAELVPIAGGGEIVDTPGVRALGLDGLTPDQVREAHPDLARYASDCRFAGCSHRTEPDCAVKAAVADGEVAAARYRSLLRLAGEAEGVKAGPPRHAGAGTGAMSSGSPPAAE